MSAAYTNGFSCHYVFVGNFSVKSGAFFWRNYLVSILEQAIMDTWWLTTVPCYRAQVPFPLQYSGQGFEAWHKLHRNLYSKAKNYDASVPGRSCKFSLEIEGQFQSFIVWCLHILHSKWAKKLPMLGVTLNFRKPYTASYFAETKNWVFSRNNS